MRPLIDFLSRYDTALFQKINRAWTSSWLDAVLPVLTDLHKIRLFAFVAAPLALVAWICVQRGRAVRVIIAAALVVGMTDIFAYRIIKHFVHRLRPQLAGVAVILRRPPQMGGSFPSNHAANAFAGAAFLSSVYPVLRLPLYSLAALVGYSRVYVGVHYPLDVMAGAFLGILFGRLGGSIFRKLERNRLGRQRGPPGAIKEKAPNSPVS